MRFLSIVTGTSSDGADVSLIELEGCGRGTRFKILKYSYYPYPNDLRSMMIHVASLNQVTSEFISRVHWELGRFLANSIVKDYEPSDYDVIVYSGYTVYHGPSLGRREYGTLQIGEASVLYAMTHKTVVYDFRTNDLASGGLGAPLIALSDAILFGEGTLTINIGGISNVTYVGEDCVIAFDTGPGNILINTLTELLYGEPYDKDGLHASRGRVIDKLLLDLMSDEYFSIPPPKNTGREYFGLSYVKSRVMPYLGEFSGDDLIRTVTRFTAESIHDQVRRFVKEPIRRIIVGGGGSKNPVLMNDLRGLFSDVAELRRFEDYGINDMAREGLGFAIIANETLHLRVGNTPATGGLPALLGKIIPGSNYRELVRQTLFNDRCDGFNPFKLTCGKVY
jgi:anhydro-N-acetylmuramic acid kinase